MNTQLENKIYDTIVIGAGISGVSAAYHLKKYSPKADFLVLEGRDNFGGTWDLFKYPGIRADTDMHTMGFSFKPWNSKKFIADGPSIMGYLNETIEENSLKNIIKFNMHIESASWNSEDSLWELNVKNKKLNKLEVIRTKFIQMCAGYYSYESGHKPFFKGSEDFTGQIIHPQEWDSSIDYENKTVAVIGSGATAVTIVPEIAKKANHVTMIQRSPTYIVSYPSEYKILHLLNYISPKLAHKIIRLTNILRQRRIFKRARRSPKLVKDYILGLVRKELPDFDIFPKEILDEITTYSTPRGTYFDAYPLHILTTSWLAELQKASPDSKFHAERFRPNFVIDTDEEGLAELAWCGKKIQIGHSAVILCDIPTVRCSMTAHATDNLPKDPLVLRTIVKATDQNAGAYANIINDGEITVGDDINLV